MPRIASLLFAVCFLSSSPAWAAEPATEDNQIRKWIADLGSDDLRERWYAAYALGQAGPEAADAIEPLMAILGNLGGHEHVRGMAAWALGRMGPGAEQAVPVLIGTLGSAHLSVRRNAPLALAQIGPPAATPAVPQLVGLLGDPDPEVRVNAAVALWKIDRHKQAIPTLGTMVAAPGPGAYEAAVALGQLDAVPEQAALGHLVGAFAHPDEIVRQAAARSVGGMGDAAIGSLQTALDDARDQVRQTAVEALGWMGSQAMDSLVAALRNDSPAVRRLAARALGHMRIKAAAAEPALVAALNDPDPEVRQAVAWAIGKVRAER